MERMKASDFPQELLICSTPTCMATSTAARSSNGAGISRSAASQCRHFRSPAAELRLGAAGAQGRRAHPRRIRNVITAGNGSIKGYLARPAKREIPRAGRARKSRTQSLYRRCGASLGDCEFHRVCARWADFVGGYPGDERRRAALSECGWSKDDRRFRRGGQMVESPSDWTGSSARSDSALAADGEQLAVRMADLGAAAPFYGGGTAAADVPKIWPPCCSLRELDPGLLSWPLMRRR